MDSVIRGMVSGRLIGWEANGRRHEWVYRHQRAQAEGPVVR